MEKSILGIMISIVCTLFEGGYHYGLAALANSLFAHGFRGMICAGYRGPLPPWVNHSKQCDGFSEFSPMDGLTLRFIPLKTEVHLTNYKPDFMLQAWEKHCPQAKALFYFDPDITIKCRWTFFEEWVEAGVAVCEDVNGSMANNHPIRYAWRKLLQPNGLVFRNSCDNYYNCGFIGLRRDDRDFLNEWQNVQSAMQKCGADFQSLGVGDRTFPFTCRDQDALNITCMVTVRPVSPVGQDGMDFQHGGGYIMSHAVGRMKPWDKPFIRLVFLRGVSPSLADKGFFQNLKFPIRPYTLLQQWFNRFRVLTASFFGRFIRNF